MKKYGIDLNNEISQNAFIYLFMGSYQAINFQLEICMKKFNLSVAKFNVLMTLKHQNGGNGLSQAEIGKKLLVTAANITKIIDKLEEKQLLTKEPKDRRTNIIKITKKGSILLDEVGLEYQKTIDKIIKKISQNELTQINIILGKLCKGVE